MAHFATQFSLLLVLLVLVASTHARESQFFNKAPAATTTATTTATTATNKDAVFPQTTQPETTPQLEQPDFLPDNEPQHGLYGIQNQNLPRNYNPVSYVTESSVTKDSPARVENTNLPEGGAQNYFATPEEQLPEFNDPNFVKEAASFGVRGSTSNSFPQGMSDTRSLENGKYHYDIEAERYNSNHPYENFGRTNPEYDGFIGGGSQKSLGRTNPEYDGFVGGGSQKSLGRTNPEYDGFIGGGSQKSLGGYQQHAQNDEFVNNWNP